MAKQPVPKKVQPLIAADQVLDRVAKFLKNAGVVVGVVSVVLGSIVVGIWQLAGDSVSREARKAILHLLAGKESEAYIKTLSEDDLNEINLIQIIFQSRESAKINEELVDSVFMSRIYRYFPVDFTTLTAAINDKTKSDSIVSNVVESDKVFVFANRSQSYHLYINQNLRDRSFDNRPLYYNAQKYFLQIGSESGGNRKEMTRLFMSNVDISCEIYSAISGDSDLEYTMVPVSVKFDDASKLTEYSFDMVIVSYKKRARHAC